MLRFWSWGCTGELDLTGSKEGLITEEIKCSGVCGEIVCCCSQGGYAIKCQSISDLYFNLIFYQKVAINSNPIQCRFRRGTSSGYLGADGYSGVRKRRISGNHKHPAYSNIPGDSKRSVRQPQRPA